MAPFVVGAMIPDGEYLLRLEPWALVSHTWRGVFTFCLPAGALALVAWRSWLRGPLLHLFALRGLGALRAASAQRPIVRWSADGSALLVGIVTHLVWDAFTHWDAWGARLVPALAAQMATVAGATVHLADVMQLASTLVGGAVVLAWLARRVNGSEGWRALLAPWRLRVLVTVFVWALVVAAWNAGRTGMMSDPSSLRIVAGRVVVGGLLGLVSGLVAYAAWARRHGRRTA